MKKSTFLLILQCDLKVTIDESGFYECLKSVILFILRLKKYGFFRFTIWWRSSHTGDIPIGIYP